MLNGLFNGWKTVFGDQSRRDEHEHLENRARHEAYSREYSYQVKDRYFFDALMDGINRIPRPAMVLHVFGLMWLAVIDPNYFRVVMAAMSDVPPWLWGIMTAVVVFYFGGRAQQKEIAARTPRTTQTKRRSISAAPKARADKEDWAEEFLQG